MRVHVVIASIIVVFAVLHLVAYIVYAASGSIGCSAGATREWTRQASAAVGALIKFETTLSKGSGGSTTSMRLWNYIHGMQVYYDSFYGGFGYGSVTRNYYFVLIGTALDTNVTFTHKVGAFPTSCETYGQYSTNFDTANIISYAAGDELALNSTYTYIYAPQPSTGYFYITMGFRFQSANITAVTEYTLADIFGLLKVNQRYSPEANITHNYIIIKSSDNSIQLKANSRDLQIVIYMKWDSAASAFYISWVEFNNYKIYVQQHATANAITITSDPRFSNSLYLPQQAVSQDLLEPMFQSQGYGSLQVAYLYYDVMNTQIANVETYQWWYDSVSDTAYYKLSVSPTPQANITLYSYKLPIYIQENSGQALSNYPVRVTIDAGVISNLDQINTSTVYFTDSSGTPLYFWIESYDPSIPRLVAWVKVPSIPASSSTTIYMHWGDPNANNQSYNNATSVFLLFDDFSVNRINTTWFAPASTNYYYSNGWLHVTSTKTLIVSNITFTPPFEAAAKLRVVQVGRQIGFNVMDDYNARRYLIYFLPTYNANPSYDAYFNYGGTPYYWFGDIAPSSGTHVVKLVVKPDYTAIVGEHIDTGTLYSKQFNLGWNTQTYVSLGGWWTGVTDYTGQEIAFDYVYVRPLVDPEPSVSYGSVVVDRPVGWELWWPRQVSFQFDGDVVVDYALVGATPSDAFVSFNPSTGKSTVWLPYPKHATGFVNFEVYWHVGNASAYGLAPTPDTGGGTGGSNSTNTTVPIGGGGLELGDTGGNSNIMQAGGVWSLLRYAVPIAIASIMTAVWGVAGAVASSMPLLYLSYAGLAPAWLAWLPALGGILYAAYKIYTRRGGT